jgi:hypothetical protein
MKKLIALAALMGAVSLSFGQGIVSFANSTGTRVSTNGTVAANAGGPVGSWYYALFRTGSANTTAPSTSIDPTTAGWTLVAIGTNAGLAGTFTGNTTTEGVVATPTAPSTDDYVVAGWSVNIGTTWAQVQQAFGGSASLDQAHVTGNTVTQGNGANSFWFGISTTFADNIIAQPTGSSINGLFGTTPGLIQGFRLNSFTIPEPSSCALIGLASATLVILRRRRK